MKIKILLFIFLLTTVGMAQDTIRSLIISDKRIGLFKICCSTFSWFYKIEFCKFTYFSDQNRIVQMLAKK